jgi:hypothetical protein
MESPKKNNNVYKSGKIYKIVDVGYNEQYFGSTTVELSKRMAKHRSQYRLSKTNTSISLTSFFLFDKYGVENCKIELIELYPCASKEELRKREGYWIKREECVNKIVAGRTPAEYYIDNIEKMKEYHRLHFDAIMERKREYYANNKERLLQWHSDYRERNRSIINEKARDYCARNRDRRKEEREEYKDEINERRREKIPCPHCEKEVARSWMYKHLRLHNK